MKRTITKVEWAMIGEVEKLKILRRILGPHFKNYYNPNPICNNNDYLAFWPKIERAVKVDFRGNVTVTA